MAELSDAELVVKARPDALAFQELVARYNGFVFNCARKILQNEHDAHDATQETWTKFYFRGVIKCQYDIRLPLRPYLARIAVRESIKIKREWKRRYEIEITLAELLNRLGLLVSTDDAAGPDLGDLESRDQRLRDLFWCVQQLPFRQMLATALELLGKTDQEIAAVLEITENAVRQLRSRARRNLRDCLTRKGVEL